MEDKYNEWLEVQKEAAEQEEKKRERKPSDVDKSQR